MASLILLLSAPGVNHGSAAWISPQHKTAEDQQHPAAAIGTSEIMFVDEGVHAFHSMGSSWYARLYNMAPTLEVTSALRQLQTV